MLFTSRPRFTPLCLLLFSDLLLITQPKRWVLRGRGGSLSWSREEASSRTPALLSTPSSLGSGQRLQVLDYAHRSLVQAQQVPDPSGPPTFRLSLLSNHQGRPTHRLLQAASL